MNRRSLLTGIAALALWPLPMRARVRKELRVFTDRVVGPLEIGWNGSFRYMLANGKLFEVQDASIEWREVPHDTLSLSET